MASPLSFIPLGTLAITRDDTGLTVDEWKLLEKRFGRWGIIAPTKPVKGVRAPKPFDDTEDLFLLSAVFKNYKNLVAEKWIRVHLLIRSEDGERGTARIHALADDVDNKAIDRDRAKLRRSRRALISQLDFSPGAWSGYPTSTPTTLDHVFRDEEDANDSTSLLQMFNTIPSPNPAPHVLTNPFEQDAIYNVLEGNLPGLNDTSKLYDYQRRSAAVMIQRESEPGQFLDPRLTKATDQNGAAYYYDTSSSVLVKEPRFYDGVRGGILAEQMGSGKTLICLAVILATRHLSTRTPDIYQGSDVRVRQKIGSLADMAASNANVKGAPWKVFFNVYNESQELEYHKCIGAIRRNPSRYHIPEMAPKRLRRHETAVGNPAKKVRHTHASIVIVPNNLVQQWIQEIEKHIVHPGNPAGLKVLKLTSQKEEIPNPQVLAAYDLVIITQSRLDRVWRETMMMGCPLAEVHFKRCIVDEGHKIGYAKINNKSNVLLAIDALNVSARWIVTGTPATGLFGVDDQHFNGTHPSDQDNVDKAAALAEAEKGDLEKIGAIASLYLNARPWSNSVHETGDTTADWAVYVMQPKHSARSTGRMGVLRATLNSLIVRHRLSELNTLLPSVNENVVVLDGSYQDKLSLNIFSMMIIFNAVQSQRVDMDYFFHARQRKALLQLVHNLKQSSFFGGAFFAKEDILKALETAETFLQEKKVLISEKDEALLKQAVEVAQVALDNQLKDFSNKYNEVPIFIRDFLPNGVGSAWSLDDRDANPTCTDAGMVLTAQKLIASAMGKPTKLNSLLNGQLEFEGRKEQADQIMSGAQGVATDQRPSKPRGVLAGNTKLGGERVPRHLKSTASKPGDPVPELEQLPDDLQKAMLVSTVSAKLSYLIDAVVEHQDREKMIIFYENENVAWYLAGLLEVIHVRHLIYASKLTYARKMEYVDTFNHDPKIRVILMDLSQAAVGLDMRAASRVYFINPVLNPQIQAQAIGRARRISQQKPVTVETLVLRDSIEEVIMERKKIMSQFEHWKCKSILDDQPIYNWILNAGIIPLPKDQKDYLAQAIPLKHPQPIFGSKFAGAQSSEENTLANATETKPTAGRDDLVNGTNLNGLKRSRSPESQGNGDLREESARPARRLRFSTEDECVSDERPAPRV
ncbi:P-loop containing nucleoside triphosphate hydrolase protein [Colletotrichum godetiae]|uniref:P-loop containing nucleoside triphosphate hydrolase protein n=1 Tax=Colletotrichum godetiae TaxID=1209918 RepID=A0AAJ0AXQ8_9PEZI|nr:P-loop containing nucleoside triphosphate hydrolase protein [Colletotrichum godetiae]KAK1690785.1 P-loop containing nucleoside triphosphate hydrolase protein [Colletotrichum godetiae]